jgi:uncharacterized protein (DUF885 family)
MHSLKTGLPLPLAVLLTILLTACRAQTEKQNQVPPLVENFVRTELSFSPSNATAQGYHKDGGVALDELLDDYSPAGIQRLHDFSADTLHRVAGLTQGKLGDEDQADLEIVRLQCESTLLDLNQIQSYRHNPTIYVEMIGNALYSPFILNYAPEAKRMEQITARMEKIPAALESARQNLQDAPQIWNQVAQGENDGNIDLIEHTIRPKVPASLQARFNTAAANAVQALKAFNTFLKNDLSKRTSDWRLGAKSYGEKFKLTLDTGDTPQQTLADAETVLAFLRQDMHKQAVALYPKFFPGKTPPEDLNTVVSQVLDKIAQQHTTPGHYFEDAKRDLAETTQFVKHKHLLELPDGGNLQVIPTPEFMRGIYGVGGFSPAPALEPNLGSYYWITPFTPDMSPARVESKLREYNFYGLKILTIHEAMPGHFVQAEYASEVEPKWRRALRGIFSNTPYVEGWAVYATELMINQGYQNTPEMRLTFGKQMLRVVANTILDVKLQTMGMTDQEALDLMIKNTFQEKEEAEKKLQRAKLSSCQLPTYFVGWRGWDRLRAAYEKKLGSSFKLSEFHERALKEGGVPLPVLSRLLMR